ncbi:MAG: leucine-rich repeat protein [Bacteroidales bacterium]|nr:leucine-rich repeat protein [Bacteroidales bacterium]
MKRIVLLVLSLFMALVAYAQVSFYAVSPSGHQLMYEVTGSGQVKLIAVGPSSTPISGNLVIPSTVNSTLANSYTVTAIDDYVFSQSSELTGVSIPSTITSIGDDQFVECGALTSISVDTGNPVYDSRNNCNAIIHTATNTLVTGCRATTIPSTVTAIGEDAFNGMFTGATSDTLAIPASVSSIFDGAFGFCESLDCITVDASNPYFDSRNNCNAIIHTATNTLEAGCRATTIPADVTAIGTYAFIGIFATLADTITIPASVTSISTGAFAWCEALSGITSLATVAPTLGNRVFYNVNSQIPVHIPAGSLASYQSEWSYFSNFIQPTPDTIYYMITATSAADTMGSVYGSGRYAEGESATLTATANAGFHFLHWQDGNSDNPRTISVTSDSTFVAYFEADEPEEVFYTISVSSADEAMGSVCGSGSYAEGESATLTATANAGFHFLHWQDGNSDNPRTISVTSDSTFVAYFEADEPQGIDAVDGSTIQVYPNPTIDLLHIDGTFSCAELYNLSGQRLLTTHESDINLEAIPSGQYLLVINGTTTIKILKTK